MNIIGIDEQTGFDSVGGNMELYRVVLEKYCEQGRELLEKLREGLYQKDLKLFVIHVHGLKSASKGIGALEMGEKFKELEFAGKENNLSMIEEKSAGYFDEFEALMDEITKYLLGEQACEQPDKNLLLRMKECLDSMDIEGFDSMLAMIMERTYSDSIQKQLLHIKELYEDFDFVEAAEAIDNQLNNI